MRLIILSFLLSISVFSGLVIAQDECGTPDIVLGTLSLQSQIPSNVGTGDYYGNKQVYIIPIEFVIIGPSNCYNSVLINEIESLIIYREFPGLQQQFSPHRICLSLINIRRVCNDSLLRDSLPIHKIDDFAKFVGYDSNVITIFVVWELISNYGNPSGVANTIGGFPAYVFVEHRTILENTKVTAHEIGHCLGLYHVFASYCKGLASPRDREFVWTYNVADRYNVSNGECAKRGDKVCDTYPVPLFNKEVDWQSCGWINKDSLCQNLESSPDQLLFYTIDSLWILFNSDTCPVNHLCNTMGYIPGIYCRKGFTEGQGSRMRWYLDNMPIGKLLNTVPRNMSSRLVSNRRFFPWQQDTFYYPFKLVSRNVVVESGADLEFSAGYSITIKPPFHVKPGAKFHAYIEKKCSEFANNSTDDSWGPYWENLRGSDQTKIRLSGIEVFPTIIRASYLLNIRLMGNISGSTITVYWIFSDGYLYPVYENIPIQNQTIRVKAPQQQGLYRLVVVLRNEDGSYKVESVPVLVYH